MDGWLPIYPRLWLQVVFPSFLLLGDNRWFPGVFPLYRIREVPMVDLQESGGWGMFEVAR